jgi:hypothetical protein
MRTPLLLPVFIFISLASMAQQYNTALGLRLGGDPGMTLQQRIGKKYTVEAMLQQGLSNRTTTATALLQRHFPIAGRNLNIYLGAGPHVGFAPADVEKSSTAKTSFVGASGIAGAELRMNRLLFSLDYKAAFHLAGSSQLMNAQTGVSVRYILVKAPNKEPLIKWPFGNKRSSSKKTTSKPKWPFPKS